MYKEIKYHTLLLILWRKLRAFPIEVVIHKNATASKEQAMNIVSNHNTDDAAEQIFPNFPIAVVRVMDSCFRSSPTSFPSSNCIPSVTTWIWAVVHHSQSRKGLDDIDGLRHAK